MNLADAHLPNWLMFLLTLPFAAALCVLWFSDWPKSRKQAVWHGGMILYLGVYYYLFLRKG